MAMPENARGALICRPAGRARFADRRLGHGGSAATLSLGGPGCRHGLPTTLYAVAVRVQWVNPVFDPVARALPKSEVTKS